MRRALDAARTDLDAVDRDITTTATAVTTSGDAEQRVNDRGLDHDYGLSL